MKNVEIVNKYKISEIIKESMTKKNFLINKKPFYKN